MFCDLIQWQLLNLFTDMCSLSYLHVYRIEYVSYRQGPYRIRIVSAADRIVPALPKCTIYLKKIRGGGGMPTEPLDFFESTFFIG